MADDNKAALKEAMNVMFGPSGHVGIVDDNPQPQPEPKPAPAKKPAAAAPEPTPTPTPTPAPPAPQPPAKPRARKRTPEATPPIDLAERDRLVAEAAARGAAVAATNKGKEIVDEIPAHSDLSEEQRETLAAMDVLGNKNTRYTDLSEKTREFWKKEKEYADKFLKENPGEEFNPEDERHAKFYDENEPQYDEVALERARRDMEKQAIKEEVRQETDQRLTEQEYRAAETKRQETETEQVQTVADEAAVEMVTALVPDAGKFFSKDGKTKSTDEQWAKFEEEDPTAAEALRDEADYCARRMKELERLNRYKMTYPPDFKNKIHASLAQMLLNKEDAILELPPAQQVHDGKRFITQAKWGEMIHDVRTDDKLTRTEKQAKVRELAGKFWMLEPTHMRAYLIDYHRKRAEKVLNSARKLEERIKNRFTTPAGTPPPTPTPEPAAPPAAPAPAPAPAPKKNGARHEPAPASPGADIMPTTDKGGGDGKSALETLQSIGI